MLKDVSVGLGDVVEGEEKLGVRVSVCSTTTVEVEVEVEVVVKLLLED